MLSRAIEERRRRTIAAMVSPFGEPSTAAWTTVLVHVDGDVLRLEELLEAPLAALAADARLLDAAERRADVRDHALVQADHAGLEALAHPQRALDVAREDICDQAELGVVGRGDRVVLGLEALHGCDGAEDLLLQDTRVVGDVRQDGRLVEVAAPVGDVAADDRLRALADRVLDELLDLLLLVLVDERADLDVLLGAAAELECAHLVGQELRE